MKIINYGYFWLIYYLALEQYQLKHFKSRNYNIFGLVWLKLKDQEREALQM